ncbi:CIA30 family protein, partial [Acidobacteriota bacterium]
MKIVGKIEKRAWVLFLLLAVTFWGNPIMAQEPKTVLDFRSSEAGDRWRIVNDGVMGGLSQSRMTVTPDQTGIFQGRVSLENNGGFAMVRTKPGEFGLSGHKGLSLRVKGDGKRYQLRLRADRRFDGVAYKSDFDTVEDE